MFSGIIRSKDASKPKTQEEYDEWLSSVISFNDSNEVHATLERVRKYLYEQRELALKQEDGDKTVRQWNDIMGNNLMAIGAYERMNGKQI